MKKIIQLILFCGLFFSCDGEFTEGKNNFINLNSPIGGGCEVGNLVSDDATKINIGFSWESKGEFNSATIIIMGSSGETVVSKKYDNEIPDKDEFILDRNKDYTWKIEGVDDTGKIIPSNEGKFFSELLIPNSAPFPPVLEFTDEQNQFTLTITSSSLETNNQVTYQAYFSISPIIQGEPLNINEVDFDESGPQFNYGDFSMSTQKLKSGLKKGDYFFRVDAVYDNDGYPLISRSYKRAPLPTDTD
jgi:hypothetical protein